MLQILKFCFYHYGIGEYSTIHFSVTLQSKFWMSASRTWLFVDNFGAWKMQFGSLKVLEFCPLSLLRTLSAAVIVDSSHMTGSSSTLWSILSPPTNFVNWHDICRQCASWCYDTCCDRVLLTGISRNKCQLSLLTCMMESCCRQSLTITVIN